MPRFLPWLIATAVVSAGTHGLFESVPTARSTGDSKDISVALKEAAERQWRLHKSPSASPDGLTKVGLWRGHRRTPRGSVETVLLSGEAFPENSTSLDEAGSSQSSSDYLSRRRYASEAEQRLVAELAGALSKMNIQGLPSKMLPSEIQTEITKETQKNPSSERSSDAAITLTDDGPPNDPSSDRSSDLAGISGQSKSKSGLLKEPRIHEGLMVVSSFPRIHRSTTDDDSTTDDRSTSNSDSSSNSDVPTKRIAARRGRKKRVRFNDKVAALHPVLPD